MRYSKIPHHTLLRLVEHMPLLESLSFTTRTRGSSNIHGLLIFAYSPVDTASLGKSFRRRDPLAAIFFTCMLSPSTHTAHSSHIPFPSI
jgi:hypothetical protein